MNKAEGMIYSKMRGENMKDNIALIGFMGSGKNDNRKASSESS